VSLRTFLIVALFPWVVVAADRVEGQVVDATSDRGIAYARVGLSDHELGTVSDDEGRFRLALPPLDLPADTTILIGAPGYTLQRVTLGDLLESSRIALVPQERAYQEQVSVSAAGTGKPAIVGKALKPAGYKVGFASGQLGSEVGARIPIKRKSFIKSAHFVIARTGGERFVYRVNLYDYRDGKVGEMRLTESVLVDAPQVIGTIDVDLSRHAVIAEHDLLLTLEWVSDDAGNEVPPLMFRAKRTSKNAMRHKRRSHGQFDKVPIVKLTPGFYLTVFSLD